MNLLFAHREKHEEEIRQIQKGILDFAADYQKYFGDFTTKGWGGDLRERRLCAFAPPFRRYRLSEKAGKGIPVGYPGKR